MKEATVEAILVTAARLHGVMAVKLGYDGMPDRMLLAPGGRVAFVELKRPGGRVRPLQRLVLKRLRRLGFRAEIVDNVEDARAAVEELVR